jgi:hypothetical protein
MTVTLRAFGIASSLLMANSVVQKANELPMPVHVTEGPKLELQSSAWNILGAVVGLSGLMNICNLYWIG